MMLILCICFATTMAKFKPSDGDIYSVSCYKPIVEQGVKLGQEVVSFKNKTAREGRKNTPQNFLSRSAREGRKNTVQNFLSRSAREGRTNTV